MLFVHEYNMLNKIATNYKGKGTIIQQFHDTEYMPIRKQLMSLNYSNNNKAAFEEAAQIITNYYKLLEGFSSKNNITSQSKLASTFLEEISSYLFHNIPQIVSGEYDTFNKKVFAGLKLNSNGTCGTINKDVDFCIGKKFNITIEDPATHVATQSINLILPIVAVEVKTYLDATMFGEIKSSSKTLRSASPNSKAYVLIGYSGLADEHLIAARQDSTLTEVFALRENSSAPFSADALYEYWREITCAVETASISDNVPAVGRLLHYALNITE